MGGQDVVLQRSATKALVSSDQAGLALLRVVEWGAYRGANELRDSHEGDDHDWRDGGGGNIISNNRGSADGNDSRSSHRNKCAGLGSHF